MRYWRVDVGDIDGLANTLHVIERRRWLQPPRQQLLDTTYKVDRAAYAS
jgi:hypothetical protein